MDEDQGQCLPVGRSETPDDIRQFLPAGVGEKRLLGPQLFGDQGLEFALAGKFEEAASGGVAGPATGRPRRSAKGRGRGSQSRRWKPSGWRCSSQSEGQAGRQEAVCQQTVCKQNCGAKAAKPAERQCVRKERWSR